MDNHKNIDMEIVGIIENELGQKTASLFVNFYDGFPHEEQVGGAREILNSIVGQERTSELLKKFEKSHAKTIF